MLLNGDEVELNFLGKITEAAYIPKANSNSSKRIRVVIYDNTSDITINAGDSMGMHLTY